MLTAFARQTALTGVLRLLDSSLGGQGGWRLGFAVVAGLGLVALTRLRRRDPRTGRLRCGGWL